MFAETAQDHKAKEDSFIYCAVNAYWESVTYELPVIPDGMEWETVAYSGDDKAKCDNNFVTLMPRSTMLLLGHTKKNNRNRKGGKKDV